MTNKRSTKRALLLSALSLLMCVSMLIGSTFAWFTDSVTSAGNKIQSGTLLLDLELYDVDKKEWNSIKESKAPIFTYDRWEPGYTEVQLLKVENEGTLALKWLAKFVTAQEPLSDLAKVIDVYVRPYGVLADVTSVTYPADRSLDGYTKVGTVSEFVDTIEDTTNGELKAGEAAYLGIALKMQESAGNEYQGLELGAFDIQILATQLTYEDDSFNDQYDANLDLMQNGISRVLDDGSTAFYYNKESGYEGRVRLTALPENLGSEYAVPSVINDLGSALVGITLDKLTVPSGLTYGYKSLEGATIENVVIADGATTVPNRLFYKANIGNVVIPDSVTYLEESAFQQVYMKELVVPASVETFGVHAFAGSTLEKITFEGKNLVFDNRPMRECANLRTVVFNCDDITFMNTTTNGDCWISNKGANGKDYSNITFYVKNETVAAKVRAAIIHEDPATTPIYVDEAVFVNAKNATELQNALNAATVDTIINITADITGNVTAVQKPDVEIVINGNENKFFGSITIDGKSATYPTAAITIRDVNFDATALTTDACINMGAKGNNNTRYVSNLTVENCTFTGNYPTAEPVGIKTYTGGGQNLTVKKCTATNMHSLAQIHNVINMTVEDCVITGSKNGIGLGASRNAKVINCEMSVFGYGIRGDAEEKDSAATITDCKINGAYIPVVIREAKSADDSYSLTVNGTNTIAGTTNADGLWCAIGDEEYGDVVKEALTTVATVTVTVNDAGLPASGVYGATN